MAGDVTGQPDDLDSASDPVIARMQYGVMAERFRRDARLDPGEAERQLCELSPKMYPTKLTKIESGTLAPAPQDVEAQIQLYRLSRENAEQLASLGVAARQRVKRGHRREGRSRQYVALERRATKIRMVYNFIPGLLQTYRYAFAALQASPVVTESAAVALAHERADRGSSIVRPGGPDVWIALGEDALDRCSGGAAVLVEQLRHLLAVAEMPNVRFRVIRRAAGNVAALSAPFTLLETKVSGPIAHVATAQRGDYVKAEEPFFSFFADAWDRAEPEEASLAILRSRITDLSTDKEHSE